MFPDASVAYCVTLAGLTIAYIELLRPGLILPGVVGVTLALLGVASLAAHVVAARGVVLLCAGLLLTVADAKFQLRGAAAAVGAMAWTFGARWLVAASEERIGWAAAAGASIPFLGVTWQLIDKAFRARANKREF